MEYVIDACSLINLDNTHSLEMVCRLPACRMLTTPIVFNGEIPTALAEVTRLIGLGIFGLVDDAQVLATTFLNVKLAGDLGDGETSCIAACAELGFDFCCDDRKARSLGATFLTERRVTGSIGLLKRCVQEGVIDCDTACKIIEEMRKRGGFLPAIGRDFFQY